MLAGLGVVDITPPVGSTLNGFIARLSGSTGLDLPLQARALWLEHGPGRCLIVTLDVLGVAGDFADRLVSQLSADLDLPEGQILIACSHTHSGPMTVAMRGLGPADESYLSRLASAVSSAAADATRTKCPVRAAWGSAPVEIAVNRRQVDPRDGSVRLGYNEMGPRDPAVRTLHLRGAALSIILMEHACHPYCLGGNQTLISPDFWGYAALCLAERGHQAIYLNGCCGDQTPRLAFQGPTAARQQGEQLAAAALRACEAAREEHDPEVRATSGRIEIPHDRVPPLAEIEQSLRGADHTVRPEERENQAVQSRLRAAWNEWFGDLKRAVGDTASLPPIPARCSVVRVGRGALAVLPGEVFFEIGQRLASHLDADPVCVAAYGHGYIGYVPTPEAFAQGGYEVDEAHRYVALWRIAPETGQLLIGETVGLWQKLGGRTR